jgi:O-antigen/teichoic acid export membrane protein
MLDKKQISKNVLFSILEVVISSLLLFILYRYIIEFAGVASLGVWSLVLATTSVARMGELGIGGCVVKYVANYLGRGDKQTASNVIETALLALTALLLVLGPAIYLLLINLLPYLLSGNDLALGKSLLPYALISLFFNMIITVVYSGLDGCQRVDVSKTILMLGNLLYLGLSFFFVTHYGIMGLAFSQVIQAIFVLLVSWVMLYQILEDLPLIPLNFSKELLREIFVYGINFQAITIMSILMEPLSKALLSRYGGVEILGYYEMANKLIVKMKSLLVNANQVLVPVYASEQAQNENNISEIYTKNIRLLMFIALPFYLFWMAIAPEISQIWIGNSVSVFIWSMIFLSFSWLFVTLSGPAYFAFIGLGVLRRPIQGHLLMAIINTMVGILLGELFGYKGVLIATSIAFYIGSTFLTRTFIKDMKIKHASIFIQSDVVCGVAYIIVTVCSWFLVFFCNSLWLSLGSKILLFGGVALFSFWFHPVGKKIKKSLFHLL